MVVSCSTWNCGNKQITGSGLKFHHFPLTRPLFCKKWVTTTKRSINFIPNKYSRLCGDHFVGNDYKYSFSCRELKHEAIPSIFTFPNHLQPGKKVKRAPPKRFAVEDISKGQAICSKISKINKVKYSPSKQQLNSIIAGEDRKIKSLIQKIRRKVNTIKFLNTVIAELKKKKISYRSRRRSIRRSIFRNIVGDYSKPIARK